VVHRTIKDMARRKCSVIISGLPELTCQSEDENKRADESAFFELCEDNLSVKPAIAFRGAKRLGRHDGHRPRRLLVCLTSETSAASLLSVAKDLRQSSERYIAENVYINPDLTPGEANAAFERRQRRRATTSTRRLLRQVPSDDTATAASNSSTTSLTVADTQFHIPSTDEAAAGSYAIAAATTSTSSSSATTGTDVSTGATNQPFLFHKQCKCTI